MWGRALLVVFLVALTVSGRPPTMPEHSGFEFILPGGIVQLPEGADRVGESPADEGAIRQLVGRWLITDYPTALPGFEPAGPITIDLTAQSRYELGAAQSFEFRWWGDCYGFAGTYVADGSAINFASTIATERTCEPKATVVEPAVATLLQRVDSWSRIGDNAVFLQAADAGGAMLRRPDSVDPVAQDADTVVSQVHLPDRTGFLLRVAEQRAADGERSPTEVGWVAWEAGTGQAALDGVTWEADRFASRDAYRPDRVLDLDFQLTRVITEGGLEQSRCVVADLNSTRSATPATLRRVEYAGLHLYAQEEDSMGDSTGHFSETVGVLLAECGSSDGTFELGVAPDVGQEWTLVTLDGEFESPIVVAGPATHRGMDAGVVEIRNVTAESFEVRFHEWDYLDGQHLLGEDVPFLVVEEGVTVLPSGGRIEAGVTSVAADYSNVLFADSFDSTPVVLTTVLR